MEFIKNHKNWIIVAALVALIGIGYAVYRQANDKSNEPVESSQPEPVTDNSQFAEPDSVAEPAPETPQKTPEPSATVIETPAVYTAFGHSADRPLPQGQVTETSCTTDAGVECYVVFRSGSQEVTFEPKTTDAGGGEVWEWTGGKEVGTGTWQVTAVAGDKVSSPETIHVM